MKLPDFSNNHSLNELRQQMGANLILWAPGIEKLETIGIVAPLDTIEPDDDGTLVYKGERLSFISEINMHMGMIPNSCTNFMLPTVQL